MGSSRGEGGSEERSDVRGKMWRFRGKRDGMTEDRSMYTSFLSASGLCGAVLTRCTSDLVKMNRLMNLCIGIRRMTSKG